MTTIMTAASLRGVVAVRNGIPVSSVELSHHFFFSPRHRTTGETVIEECERRPAR
jgi:hypothetical protein